MIKNYILTLAAFALSFTMGAQIIFQDDFESYTLGDMGLQNTDVWSAWSGSPDDGSNILVVDDIAQGTKAGYVGPGEVQDVLLLLGNKTAGVYYVSFDMYITAGSTAYFNVQGQTDTSGVYQGVGTGANGPGVFNSGNILFNQDGLDPGLAFDETANASANYPEDAWFEVVINFDVNALTYIVRVDGVDLTQTFNMGTNFAGDAVLGAIDFFSIDNDANFWIDNVVYSNGQKLGLNDLSDDKFSVYPNPVQDVLKINTTNSVDLVQVYDVTGALVLTTTPSSISPSIDMSTLSTGAYMVKVTIGDAVKTVKVLK